MTSTIIKFLALHAPAEVSLNVLYDICNCKGDYNLMHNCRGVISALKRTGRIRHCGRALYSA